MNRTNLLDILYTKNKSPLEFNFDSLYANPIHYYLSPYDIMALNNIASSNKYAAKVELKYKEIEKIMVNRGFKRFAGGTNRVVYSYLEDQSFVVKIAIDKIGLGDNPAEYKNQNILKPFVTKVFNISQCGTVGLFERILPIINVQEFLSIADDVFDLITNKIIGKYVLEDIGTKYFMNWGVRNGFGPCLLDFPYVFELDGNKLFCNKVSMVTGEKCGGVIDYNDGFNNLVCTHCGKKYIAKELETNKKEKLIIIEGDNIMNVKLVRQDGTVLCNPSASSDFIQKPVKKQVYEEKKSTLKVSLSISPSPQDTEEKIINNLNFEYAKPEEYKIEPKKYEENIDVSSKFIPTKNAESKIMSDKYTESDIVNTETNDELEEDEADKLLKEYGFLEEDETMPRIQKMKPSSKKFLDEY